MFDYHPVSPNYLWGIEWFHLMFYDLHKWEVRRYCCIWTELVSYGEKYSAYDRAFKAPTRLPTWGITAHIHTPCPIRDAPFGAHASYPISEHLVGLPFKSRINWIHQETSYVHWIHKKTLEYGSMYLIQKTWNAKLMKSYVDQGFGTIYQTLMVRCAM